MMKLLRFWIVVPVLWAGLSVSAHAEVLLFDDFDGSSLSPTWTIKQGFATVGGGYVDVHGSTPGSRDGWIVANEGRGNPWSDYHFSTHLIADGGGDGWYHGDLAFRVQDWHGWTMGTFYRITLNTPIWSGGAGAQGGGAIALSRYVDDEVAFGIASADPLPGIINDRDNVVDIWANGNHIQVSVNGHQLLDFVDSQPLLTGGVALGAIWESHVRYDYASVETVTTPVPEPDESLMLLVGAAMMGYQVRRKQQSSGQTVT
jgi:hypothetical protein